MKNYRVLTLLVGMLFLITGIGSSETFRQGGERISFNPSAIVTKTTAYTVTSGDSEILVNATGGAITITLPTIASVTTGGTKSYKIKKTDASTYVVTVTPATGDTIGFESTRKLLNQNDYMVISTGPGKNWSVDYESPYIQEDYESGTVTLPSGSGQTGANLEIEGATADSYEMTITATDPTADRTTTLPNANVDLTGSDGQILVYKDAYGWNAVTPSGAISVIANTGAFTVPSGYVTGAMVNASAEIALSKIAECSDGQIIVGNASGVDACVTPTGALALTNAGVGTIPTGYVTSGMINANTIVASDINDSTLTVTVLAGASNGVIAKTSGAVITGYYPLANLSTEIVNSVRDFTTGVEIVLTGNAVGTLTFKVVVIEP